MATATDKKRWDDLHAALAKAEHEAHEFERGLWSRYGGNYQRQWLKKGERDKIEKLRARADKVGDKIIDMIVRISPRGDAWASGVPTHWLRSELTWEDMIRPRNEPLSIVPPPAYGSTQGQRMIDRLSENQRRTRRTGVMNMGRRMMSRRQPSLPGFPDIPEELDVQIPDMPQWQQIGGDMSPDKYGGIIARSDGYAIELLEIQPVREHVGDDEAAEVGFPFWTREGSYDLDDLNPGKEEVKSALSYVGLDQNTLEDLSPTQRALAIAEALLSYGHGVDEGPAGWSYDIIHEPVKWMSGQVAGAEYLADEDDEFIREVLLGDFEVDYEAYGPNDEEPESGFKVEVSNGNVEITEWTDIEAATGDEQEEGEEVVKTTASLTLDDLFDPKGKHRGSAGSDRHTITLKELAEMDEGEREEAVVAAAHSYMAYWGGEEEFVENVGD